MNLTRMRGLLEADPAGPDVCALRRQQFAEPGPAIAQHAEHGLGVGGAGFIVKQANRMLGDLVALAGCTNQLDPRFE